MKTKKEAFAANIDLESKNSVKFDSQTTSPMPLVVIQLTLKSLLPSISYIPSEEDIYTLLVTSLTTILP
jgi:hypothetical protein